MAEPYCLEVRLEGEVEVGEMGEGLVFARACLGGIGMDQWVT